MNLPVSIRRLLGILAILVMVTTACDGSPRVYQPIAASDLPGVCYFLYYPEECIGRGIPMPMPSYWHYRYAGYYGNRSRYINRYVPTEYRTIVITKETTYDKQHKTEIKQEQAQAKADQKSGQPTQGPATTLGGGKKTVSSLSGGGPATTLGGGKKTVSTLSGSQSTSPPATRAPSGTTPPATAKPKGT